MDFEAEVKKLMEEHEKSMQWPKPNEDDHDVYTKDVVTGGKVEHLDSDGNKVTRFKKVIKHLE